MSPRSRSWQTVPVDQRVREAGGWLGPFGAPSDEPHPSLFTPVCGLVLPDGLCSRPAQHHGTCQP